MKINLPEFFKRVKFIDKKGKAYKPDSLSAKMMYYRYKMLKKHLEKKS